MKLVLIRHFRVTGILLAGILTAYVRVNCHTDHGAAVVRQTTRLTTHKDILLKENLTRSITPVIDCITPCPDCAVKFNVHRLS